MQTAEKYCPCAAKVGQVAGEIIIRQVVNSSRNPITNIAFFYIDRDGQQISGPATVDENGLFHVTYPQAPDEVFIQFSSYDPATSSFNTNYESRVISFNELYNAADGLIVMSKPGSGLSNMPVILAGGLLLLLVPSKEPKKKVGAMSIEAFKRKSTVEKVAITGGALLVGYVLIKSLFGYKPTPQQKQIISDAKSMLDFLHFNLGIDVTMSISQFASLASSLANASVDCGTNEGVIYHIIEKLNNDADVYQLIVSADVLSYKSCAPSEGNWFGNVHYTVPELIVSELTASEITIVNNILSAKGIQYRF